ncbi:hypothetical protein C8R43DRAFT_884900 [Mycena crocata]|nr:hypothetical protein C8R43DRAFT_884900 [Mycena crocata]
MAAPFVYVPEASSSTPYSAPYYNPYYASPNGIPSPFLPPLAFPSSPYLGPIDGGVGTASPFNPNSVLWPDDVPDYESPYTASWAPLSPRRQRTNSWQGPALTPNSPFLAPQLPAYFQPPSSPYTRGHKKSNSWGNSGQPPPRAASTNPYLPPQTHPWLNADAPSPTFHFDFAPIGVVPLRLLSANPPQSTLASPAELAEPAFHPPRTALRILHPRLPFWPVDLALRGAQAQQSPPPITVKDVLGALHRALHRRMMLAAADWSALSEGEAGRVTRAFAQRCRAEAVRGGGPVSQLRDCELAVRNEGVKRVDFLMGKTVFEGLVRAPGDPEGCVRLVTA